MQSLKKNTTTIIVILATVILAGVAIFTAIKLYQTRQGTITPNAPTSHPAAATVPPSTCSLTFEIATPSPSPTGTGQPTATPSPSPVPTASPSPSPSPSPVPQCNSSCTTA